MANLKISLRKKGSTNFEGGDKLLPETDWGFILNKPATFVPDPHGHAIADITNLQSTLNGKAASSHNHDDRYYTEYEIQNSGINMRELKVNANGVPTSNLGNPTVAEMALFQEQFNNKTEFYDTSKITFETFDGTNWTDITSSISLTERKRLMGGDQYANVHIPRTAVRYRITLRAIGYDYLNALYSYFSTQGNSTQVHIWKKHDSGSWISHTAASNYVSSYPGHLYLPFPTIPWNATATLGSHYHEVRIEFIPNWTHATNTILLQKLQLWGGYPAGKRTVYSVDSDKVVTFPANIKVGANNVIVEGDARLTNSRPASDVYTWAKAANPPTLDAIPDGTTYKRVTQSDKDTWNGKQNALGFTPVPTTRTIAGLDLTTNRSRDTILGVSTNGYYRRTGTDTYDIRTVANLQSDLGLGSAAYTASTAYKASSYVPSWSEVTSKPSWIGASKPTYNYTDINSRPLFSVSGTTLTITLP